MSYTTQHYLEKHGYQTMNRERDKVKYNDDGARTHKLRTIKCVVINISTIGKGMR